MFKNLFSRNYTSKSNVSKHAFAVVTGAGSGIGQAFAIQIAKRGGEVVCADINLATAQQTADTINAAGGKAFAVQCDVTDLAQVESLAEQAEKLLSAPIDLVINNAGVGAGGQRIGEISMDDWKWVMNVNLWGVIHGCHVFAPRLRALGRGGMINVASTASFSAAPLMGAYNATKAAVLAMTALCPTIVKTNIFEAGRIDAAAKKFAKKLAPFTGLSAESVAITTLDALDQGQLYVLPQFDAKIIWRTKRLMPRLYTRGAGLINRLPALNKAS
jgi:short-subunit dehydrogenase